MSDHLGESNVGTWLRAGPEGMSPGFPSQALWLVMMSPSGVEQRLARSRVSDTIWKAARPPPEVTRGCWAEDAS